jgi:hypothetical protein
LTFMEKTESASIIDNRSLDVQAFSTVMDPIRNQLLGGKNEQEASIAKNKIRVPASPKTSQSKAAQGLGSLPVRDFMAAAVNVSEASVVRKLDIQLNWSEYFQGEWTTRESSGFGYETFLVSPFDPKKIFVTVSKETDAEGAVWIILNGFQSNTSVPAFRVLSKNSHPQLKYAAGTITSPYFTSPQKEYNTFRSSGALSVTFTKTIVTTDGVEKSDPPAPQTILAKRNDFSLLAASNPMKLPNSEFAPLISPVFYTDANNRNTFFVEPSLTETTIEKWEGYIITPPSQKPKWEKYIEAGPKVNVDIPPKYLYEALKVPPTNLPPDPIGPRALHSIKSSLDMMTQPGVAVQFGDALITSTGRVQDLAGITRIVTQVGGNL